MLSLGGAELEGTSGERALERTPRAPGTERALERTPRTPGTERALERTGDSCVIGVMVDGNV